MVKTTFLRVGTGFILLNFVLLYVSSLIEFTYLGFTYLARFGFDYLLIGFLILGLVLSGLAWIKLHKKVENPFLFLFLEIPFGAGTILFVFLKDAWSIIVTFLVLGFLALLLFNSNIYLFRKASMLETRGRKLGISLTFFGILAIAITVISLFLGIDSVILIFGVSFIVMGACNLFFHRLHPLLKANEKKEIALQDLEHRVFFYYFIAIFMFLFVLGIGVWQVLANPSTHQLAIKAGQILFGKKANTITGLESAVIFASLPFPFVAYINGILIDRIGRKEMFLIALFTSCVGLFLLGFLYGVPSIVLAWVFLGIGLSIVLNIVITMMGDVKESFFRLYQGLIWFVYFAGLAAGFLLGMLTKSFPFSYVALIILVAFPTAIFAILHAKDTLPSKEEREWRNCIRHLFLIVHSGICLVHHPFKDEKIVDEQLFAGGISGIISLVQELTNSNEKIQTFHQEDKTILLQYGKYLTGALISSKDLKILHHKLKNLIYDYEDIFYTYFENWIGDTSLFEPGIRFIKRHFI